MPIYVRVESLTREDVSFLREMIVSRQREVENNTKLDHNEKMILSNRYKNLNAKLGRRFPIVSTTTEDNNLPGHKIVLDGDLLDGEDTPSVEQMVNFAITMRTMEQANLVVVHHKGEKIVVKDRYGVMK